MKRLARSTTGRDSRRGAVSRMLEREGALAFWLLVPTLALLTLFIAYPFVRGVWLSVTNTVVGEPGHFIGLHNFTKIFDDSIFRTAALNTFVYTGVTTVFKLALGLWLALLLNRHFRGKAWVRAFILLPFIIPTVLSTLAWKCMFDPTFSVFNWLFWKLSIINARINWLGDPDLAMASIMAVNVWRGVPFYAISLLAGLQTINQDLHEAAAIDGANRFQRFWYVTWPLLLPVTTLKPDGELYRPWNHPLYSPFWTSAPTLDHVKSLLQETLFGTWMWNTMLIALAATLISLFCGVIAGYALARLRFGWAGLLGTAIFVTYLVPQTLLFIPLAEIIRDYNIGDTPWALILTYPTFLIPFCTWLMMGYFKTIPKELEECARIDGATRWQAMLYIILPIALPGILSAGIFAFTLSWNEFIYALVFLSSPEQKTVPVGVVSELIRGDVFFWGPLMAGALIGSVPVAIVYSFFVEHYVAGMTGSMKG